MLAACGGQGTPPAPADADEREAIAKAEEMIETGRPEAVSEVDDATDE